MDSIRYGTAMHQRPKKNRTIEACEEKGIKVGGDVVLTHINGTPVSKVLEVSHRGVRVKGYKDPISPYVLESKSG